MGIAYSTLREWRDKLPALAAALKKGKAPIDIEVENALLKRALGYEYTETKVRREIIGYTTDEKGKSKPILGSKSYIEEVKKVVLPDTVAQIYWLKNRRPDKWRDKPQTAEVAIDDPLLELFRRMDEDAQADV